MGTFSATVNDTIAELGEAMRAPRNADFILHRFKCLGVDAALAYVDGMTDKNAINLAVLVPCVGAQAVELPPDERAEYIMNNVIKAAGARIETDFEAALTAMLSGRTLLVIDGFAGAIACDAPGFDRRAVAQPVSESVIVGPHEGFNENLRTNITLLRRIIRSPRLVTEQMQVGSEVRTNVALMYMDGVARKSTVDKFRERVSSLNIDAITDIGQIEQLVEDAPYSLVPQHLLTERPDRTASCLLDGQVALLCDGSPAALVAPVTLFHLIHASDDTNMRWEYGTFIRLIRVLGMLLSMLLPGLYLALVLFHPEIIPLGLLTSIMETHAKVPFSTAVEVLILILSFDLIQESATRVPGALGSTLGIVGALILGEAAVSADIISPILVIIVALTGLGNYAMPDYQLSVGVRILRLLFIFAGAVAGLFGLSLCAFYGVTYLCSLTSLGEPFLAPVAPYRPHNPDIVLRLPLFMQKRRLFTARPDNAQRNKDDMRGWQKVDKSDDHTKRGDNE